MINWIENGFEISGEAENAAEAYDWIVANLPDLVITDIRMPVLSGLELIRKVAEAGLLSVTFIITRTSNTLGDWTPHRECDRDD